MLEIGPHNAKILIVLDAPSAESERKGLPICGAQHNLLKALLNNAKISFDECKIITVYPTKPPKNQFRLLYEKKNTPRPELSKAYTVLCDRIEEINPHVIVPLGFDAFYAVTQKQSLEAWRGSVCFFNTSKNKRIKIIPSYHPRDLFTTYSLRPICELDLSRVRRESFTREYLIDEPKMCLMPSLSAVLMWFRDFRVSKAKRLSFDTETTMSQSLLLRSIGFAYQHPETKEYNAISIPLMKSGYSQMSTTGTKINISLNSQYSPFYTASDEVRVIDCIQKIFLDTSIEIVGQNSVSFDQPVLEAQYNLEIKNHYMDTMHAHHVCYLELPKSLDFFTTFYTPYSNYWSDKITSDDRSNCAYNCMDCVVTLISSYAIEQELKELEMHDLYFKHIHKLIFALARAENRGVLFDQEACEKTKIEYEKEIESIQKEIEQEIKEEINLSSPKQLKELLYGKRHYPTQLSKTGTITTDAEAIKKLVRKFPKDKILRQILKHREISKLVSTYFNVKTDPDGVMRTSFNASGTDTGRISSSKTIRGTGANLQNIPKSIRHLFVAREGYSFVKGDLSQAETYVVAELLAKYGDNTLVKRYDDPLFDIHKWAAAGVYKCDESEITNEQRQIGKLANHSGNYGAGPGVLVSQGIKRGVEGIDYEFSKQILRTRHKQLPGLKRWWKAVEAQLNANRTLVTCFGRKRIFFGRLDESLYRTAYGFEGQSPIGDLANMILVYLDEHLPHGAHVVLQVHDEVVVECQDHLISETVECFKQAAKIPLRINANPRYIPIDISVGKDWKNCEEI